MMTTQEAKQMLLPLCPRKADGKYLSPGITDADLRAIATHIAGLHFVIQWLWQDHPRNPEAQPADDDDR